MRVYENEKVIFTINKYYDNYFYPFNDDILTETILVFDFKYFYIEEIVRRINIYFILKNRQHFLNKTVKRNDTVDEILDELQNYKVPTKTIKINHFFEVSDPLYELLRKYKGI